LPEASGSTAAEAKEAADNATLTNFMMSSNVEQSYSREGMQELDAKQREPGETDTVEIPVYKYWRKVCKRDSGIALSCVNSM
jgi:hypothetical protein